MEMELEVSKGKGYVFADNIKEHKYSADTITIDALFSPVTKVNYEVENKNIIAVPESEDSSSPEDGYIDDEVKVVTVPKLNSKTKEIIKIVVGIVILIAIALYFIITKINKGKRELTSELYKISLPKGRGKREK